MFDVQITLLMSLWSLFLHKEMKQRISSFFPTWHTKRQRSNHRDGLFFCLAKHMSVCTKPIYRSTYVSPCKICSHLLLYFVDVLEMFFSTRKMKTWILSFYWKNNRKILFLHPIMKSNVELSCPGHTIWRRTHRHK